VAGQSEEDFETLMEAAFLASGEGQYELAEKLDVLARKENARLTNAKFRSLRSLPGSRSTVTWRDVPSVFSGPMIDG
jgi:hypothetical protein